MDVQPGGVGGKNDAGVGLENVLVGSVAGSLVGR